MPRLAGGFEAAAKRGPIAKTGRPEDLAQASRKSFLRPSTVFWRVDPERRQRSARRQTKTTDGWSGAGAESMLQER